MKRILLACTLLLGSFVLHAQPEHRISYAISYDTVGGPRLLVLLSFRGTDSGRTVLQLPEAFASQKELQKAVSNLEAVSPGLRISTTGDAAQRVLLHPPGAELRLRYELRQDWTGSFVYPKNYRAVIQPGWMQLTGYSLFAHPAWSDDEKVRLSLDWSGMPASWSIANSFHAEARRYTGSCLVGDLENSVFVGGDFRLYKRKLRGQAVYTAIRGAGWTFNDTTLVRKAMRIIGGERSFWNDHKEPYFLLTLAPFSESGHYNGSKLYQSFFMNMSPDSFATAYISKLLAHEYMHRWIGGKLTIKGKEEEHYWFSEGFTEYYTYKSLRRIGVDALEDQLQAINKTIADYYLSPVRNATQKAAGDSFWLDRSYQRLPYVKGFAFAMYFDSAIATRSGGLRSLDNVLSALSQGRKKDGPMEVEVLLNALRRQSGLPVDSLYNEWVVRGVTIPVARLADAGPYRLAAREIGAFELGFDPKTIRKGSPVGGVIEGSAAWQAGLRNGQILKSASIYYDDVSQPVVIGVLAADGSERTISYLPLHRNRVLVPQYELKASR
ncbi:MAG: hypothetical protein EOO16_08705 [Chitinophagaceae bacterium]|nr:MAG: hypothetical protein EOO16_08705 [Chitinophagaceae bacterium]